MRVCKPGLVLLATWLLGGVAMSEDATIIARDGWSFDRSQFRDDTAAVEKARQTGREVSLTGWTEYDFEAPAAGWYELWISGMPEAWSRDVLVDGAPMIWFATSSKNGDLDTSRKGWLKEANLFLTQGPHRLKFRRLAHPGRLPSAWELRLANSASGRLRVVDGGPNVVRVTDEVTLKVLGGGAADASYEFLVRNESDGALTPVGRLDFSATTTPVEKKLSFRFPKQGVYEVIAKAGAETLRPADVKAGEYIVVDTQAPAAASELRTTPVVDIDCAATPPPGGFWETEGATSVVEKPLGKYRESSGRGLMGRGWGASGFSYRIKLPDIDHIYRIRVDYPDDERRSMGFWLNDGSDTRPNHLGVVNTGGVETGDRFPLTNRMLTHEAFFYPRGNEDMVIAVLNLVPGMKAAAARIRIDRVDSGLPAAPVGQRNGRTMGYYTEESGRWLRFFGGTESNVQLEHLKTLERWGQWNRFVGANLIFATINVYQANHYPSRILEGYFNTPINQARLAALAAEKYGSEFVPEFHLSGQEWFDRNIMGVWVEPGAKPVVRTASAKAEERLIRDKDGQFGYSLPFTYNVLHPEVQEMYLNIFGELADSLADTKSFAGISSRVMMSWVWGGWNVLPGLEFGYDDWTVAAFEKETGEKVAVDPASPDRYRQRFQVLTGPLREKWIAWRCQRVFDFHQRLLARIQKAKPTARLFFTWFGPDRRKSFSENLLERMREAGMDWRLYQNTPGIVIVPTVGYGRRYSTPLADVDQAEPLYDAAYRNVGLLPGRAFGFFSEYFEPNHLLDWSKLGGKPYAAFDATVPSGVNERELYAITLANCDSSFVLNGGNGWIFGTPDIIQPFLREYRALPAKPFEPVPGAADPVAMWQYKDDAGVLWFYAVNRLSVPVEVAMAVNGGGIVNAADGSAVPVKDGMLDYALEPFMMRSFRADKGAVLGKARVNTPEVYVASLRKQVDEAGALAAAIQDRRIAPEMSLGEAQEAVRDLEEARTAFQNGAYWRAKVQLERKSVVRASYLSGRYLTDVWQRSVPHGVPVSNAKGAHTVLQSARLSGDIRSISYDDKGNLWIGGDGRLMALDQQGKWQERVVFQPYAYDPGDVRHPVLPPAFPMKVDRVFALNRGKIVVQQGSSPPVLVDAASGRLIQTEQGRYVNVSTKASRLLGANAIGNFLISDDVNKQVVVYDREGRFVRKVADVSATVGALDDRGAVFVAGADGIWEYKPGAKERSLVAAVKVRALALGDGSGLIFTLSENGREIGAWQKSGGGYASKWAAPLPQQADDISLSPDGALAVLFRDPVKESRLWRYGLSAAGLGEGKPLTNPAGSVGLILSRRTPLKVLDGAVYFLAEGKLMRLSPGSLDRIEVAFEPSVVGGKRQEWSAFAFDANGDLILSVDRVDKSREVHLYRCARTTEGWSDPTHMNGGKALATGIGFEVGDLAVDLGGEVILPLPDKVDASNAVSLFRWKAGQEPERWELLGAGQAGYFLNASRGGGLLLSNAAAPSVTSWSPQGEVRWTQRRAKACPPGYADLRFPGGIAESRDGVTWIVDQVRHQVVRLNADGHPVMAVGSFGTSEESGSLILNRPTGLAILSDKQGEEWMYLADSGNGRLLKVKLTDLPKSQ